MRLSFDAKAISAMESLSRQRIATLSAPAPRPCGNRRSPYFMRACGHSAASRRDDFGPAKPLIKDKSTGRPSAPERWEDATFAMPRTIGKRNRRPFSLGHGQVTPARKPSPYAACQAATLGTAASSVRVYSDCGRPSTASAEPASSTRPRRITTTSSAMYSMTPMLCVMNRVEMPSSRCSCSGSLRPHLL